MSNIDFLIFAPLEDEFEALRDVFGITGPALIREEDGAEFYSTTVDTKAGPKRVMILHLFYMGVLGAGVMTSKLIPKVHPLAVISFGIAGGFVGDDIRKKDVFIPAQIFYYEPAKEITEQSHSLLTGNGSSSRLDHRQQSRVRFFGTSKQLQVYARRVQRQIEKAIGSKCIVGGEGPLASGEKKIADLDGPTVRLVKMIHSKTLAIEMEAAGVGAAIESWPEASPEPQFLAIKGISDDASQVENQNIKSGSQVINRGQAARNAAFALKSLISESELRRPEVIPAQSCPI
jgi:nucleoside phosphorylase